MSTTSTDHPVPLADFPVLVRADVRWGEMDAYQHVNNTVYFRLFEDARIAYFAAADVLSTAPIGPILHSTSCRFKLPLTFPDHVVTGGRVTDVGEDRFTMRYAVYSREKDCIAAEGEGLVVSFDYGSGQKAPLPESWRAAIRKLEG